MIERKYLDVKVCVSENASKTSRRCKRELVVMITVKDSQAHENEIQS